MKTKQNVYISMTMNTIEFILEQGINCPGLRVFICSKSTRFKLSNKGRR
jgi:hypothetical protein